MTLLDEDAPIHGAVVVIPLELSSYVFPISPLRHESCQATLRYKALVRHGEEILEQRLGGERSGKSQQDARLEISAGYRRRRVS